MKYSKEQRTELAAAVAGKRIASLEWSEEADGSEGYWVMVFDDGSEICFRLMAELVAAGSG